MIGPARSRVAVGAAIVVATLLLAAAVQLQAARERAYPPNDDTEESLYIRSGVAMRALTGAHNGLAADLYWIRAIQYYGGAVRKREREAREAAFVPDPPPALAAIDEAYPLLFPLLDITTTLDPRFTIAYRFGAVFLGDGYPRGAGRPDLAIALLEKGLAARPDKWEYMEDIGFVNYWFVHDFKEAARWFEKAADAPGSPWWLRSLAATTLALGGDRRSSRTMWEAIRQSADNDWLRREAERRLLQLQALDVIEALQRIADAFGARTGETPDWAGLVRARALAAVPRDPTGVPYELVAGRVRLARQSPLWPPPQEPASRLGA
jgi:hypothetical protein